MQTKKISKITDEELLIKYSIPSMGDYSKAGSVLCEILHRLDKNKKLDESDKTWIRNKGMFRFYEFLEKWEKTGKANFQALRQSYGVKPSTKFKNNISNPIITFARKYDINIHNINSNLYNIFKRIKTGKRFSKEDIIWLRDKDFLRDKLQMEYNKREVKFYLNEYAEKKTLWSLVNASAHLRKIENSKKAIDLINNINFKKIKNMNLKSALVITQGGAYRDLGKLDEALKNAEKGHNYNPSSFHPCTLLGAIYYETGRLDLGRKWFSKAEENGAQINSIDSEILSIFKRTKGKERAKLKEHLLKIDSYRYSTLIN